MKRNNRRRKCWKCKRKQERNPNGHLAALRLLLGLLFVQIGQNPKSSFLSPCHLISHSPNAKTQEFETQKTHFKTLLSCFALTIVIIIYILENFWVTLAFFTMHLPICPDIRRHDHRHTTKSPFGASIYFEKNCRISNGHF